MNKYNREIKKFPSLRMVKLAITLFHSSLTPEEEGFLDSLLGVVEMPENYEGETSGNLAGDKVVNYNDGDEVTRPGLAGSPTRSEPNSCTA